MQKRRIVSRIPFFTCGKPKNARLRMSHRVIKRIFRFPHTRVAGGGGGCVAQTSTNYVFVASAVKLSVVIASRVIYVWMTFSWPIPNLARPWCSRTRSQKAERIRCRTTKTRLPKIALSSLEPKRSSKSFRIFLFLSFFPSLSLLCSLAFLLFRVLSVLLVLCRCSAVSTNTQRRALYDEAKRYKILCNEM